MLVPVPFAPEISPLPDSESALADDALDRAQRLCSPANPVRIPAFVMTGPRVAWSIVTAARDRLDPSGDRFCEWGAGIGLVTCLAARAGWRARGIEREPALVAEGRALAAAHRVDVTLEIGTYAPPGFFAGDAAVPPDTHAPRLFGDAVTYAYAWPAEAAAIERFFAAHAPAGTMLVLYRGGSTVRAWRQEPRRDRIAQARQDRRDSRERRG